MSDIDQGTAYGMADPSWDDELIEVEAGTPAGELLRRYWHPIATSRRPPPPLGWFACGGRI